ncbi:MAG TPA: formate dehydrogenase accessory protein FdhE [Steroidobacteraceae bacterium]|nr:formate dehydrogenase accessory protein FdhE [Steroidobacteraceae bacterium]
MQRILEPGQIEALASRSVPRLRLPDRSRLFAARADRLRELSPGHTLQGYLELLAVLAAAQHGALQRLELPLPDAAQRSSARTHGMPVVPALGGPRPVAWRGVAGELCAAVGATAGFPPAVAAACSRIAALDPRALEADADRLLAADLEVADPAAAPMIMAALQVCWVALASRLTLEDVGLPESSGVCPVCGTLPVASVVRTGAPYAGYRYLHCSLCATEWHRVRVECTQCGATQGVAYHSIEGGSQAIRAESCDRCHSYRKIFYQEHDPDVDPVADDLASVTLDLLLSDAGFHRASSNPLLWQNRG